MSERFQPPGDCPVCGDPVPARALACPHCGADAATGWSADTAYDGLDLPDWAYEDDSAETAARDPRRRARHPRPSPRRRAGERPAWVPWVALLLVLLLAGLALLGRF